MAGEDIEKLRERLEKDPDSKLFVPLAEEYRKAGMFDEAIDVLQKGIESQPSYMSARVVLGKVYLEKEMVAEARTEFEKVIKIIPDNLFVHKKLAEIYRDDGETDKAAKEYEMVIKLNPVDEDARLNLEILAGEGKGSTGPAGDSMHEAPPITKGASTDDTRNASYEVSDKETSGEDTIIEEEFADPATMAEETFAQGEISEEIIEEEFEEFKNAFSQNVMQLEEVPVEDDEAAGMFPSDDEPPPAKSDNGMDSETEGKEVFPADDEPVKTAGATEAQTDFSQDVMELEDVPSAEDEAAGMFPSDDEPPPAKSDIGMDSETAMPEVFPADDEPVKTAGATEAQTDDVYSALGHAEELIGQARFSDALKVYNTSLRKHPEDKRILQKIEELKKFLRMIGKDKEELINKLEDLLNRIKQRKYELYGNS